MFEQRTAYRYRVNDAPDWLFEIARIDAYKGDAPLPNVTRWEALLINESWDRTTAEESNLGIGNCSKWDASLESVFPKARIAYRGAGKSEESVVASFFHTVQKLSDLLKFSSS